MNKKNMKRLLALLVAGTMTLPVIGCGSTTEDVSSETPSKSVAATGESASAESTDTASDDLYYNTEGYHPIVKEGTIEIEFAGRVESGSIWEGSHVAKKIEEDMGIKLNMITYADASVEKTQFAAQLASDDLPDLMINTPSVTKAQANEYGEAGYLINWMDYIDIMPNFKQFLEDNPEAAAYHKTEDGAIYSFDRVRTEYTPQDMIYVSKENQEKYGFSVEDIKTVDDFYNVLKSIKEQDPDVIPWAWEPNGYASRGVFVIQVAFGMEGRSFYNNRGVSDDGQVILNNIEENGKAFYAYMNKLWEEELVDHEAFVITQDEYETKVRNGEVVFFFDWSLLPVILGTDSSCYREYDALVSLTSEYQTTPTYIMPGPYNSYSRMMVSAKTEYPEAIMRLLDYQFSEEGFNFFYYGTEGETYDWEETPMGDKVPNYSNYWDKSKYSNASTWRLTEIVMANVFQTVQPKENLVAVHSASDEKLNDYIYNDPSMSYIGDAHLEQAIRAQAEDVRYSRLLSLSFTADESSQRSQPYTDMTGLLGQYGAQFVTGELDVEEEWDAYVKQIKVFWDQIQPIDQAAYDRMNGN